MAVELTARLILPLWGNLPVALEAASQVRLQLCPSCVHSWQVFLPRFSQSFLTLSSLPLPLLPSLPPPPAKVTWAMWGGVISYLDSPPRFGIAVWPLELNWQITLSVVLTSYCCLIECPNSASMLTPSWRFIALITQPRFCDESPGETLMLSLFVTWGLHAVPKPLMLGWDTFLSCRRLLYHGFL